MKKNILLIILIGALLVTACSVGEVSINEMVEPTMLETVYETDAPIETVPILETEPSIPEEIPETEPTEDDGAADEEVIVYRLIAPRPVEQNLDETIVYVEAVTTAKEKSTCAITITKEWYENAYVYPAHLYFSDYDRLKTGCAYDKYNSGRETTSRAADRLDALLCVNCDYAVPSNGAGGYAVARDGVVCNDNLVYSEGIYNQNTGLLTYRTHDGCSGKQLSEMVEAGKITDTFQFGPAFLLDGVITGVSEISTDRAQRTFIGTNGKPGDIWICVSDGRYNDGKSAGLTGYQCAAYLQSKGCIFGIPLDGGGSSTMVWQGKVLNAAKNNERAVVDFIYFK